VRYLIWPALTAFSVIWGCSSSPEVNRYVLSAPVNAANANTLEASDGPQLLLRPVTLPGYLDSTELVLRSGQNALTASTTARWAERLSDGVTHSLAAALVLRLPKDNITLDIMADVPNWQLLVDIYSFDVWPDGHCVLTAGWTISRSDGQSATLTGRGTFASPSIATSEAQSDAGIVAAMAGLIGNLADSISNVTKTINLADNL
jgi:uncharacterized lipoprotein YmbA